MNETATTIEATAPALPRLRQAAVELYRRLFVAGVAICTTAVAVFLLVQLSAWPSHEDETLPLFVGRHNLGEVFDIVLGDSVLSGSLRELGMKRGVSAPDHWPGRSPT